MLPCVCVWQRKTHQQDVIGIILYICSSNLKNSDRLIRKQIIKKKKNRWKNCFLSTCPPPNPPPCAPTQINKKRNKNTQWNKLQHNRLHTSVKGYWGNKRFWFLDRAEEHLFYSALVGYWGRVLPYLNGDCADEWTLGLFTDTFNLRVNSGNWASVTKPK